MAKSDWDEVKRLAADFQRAQLSSTIQRLSERNCVEIITKLIELKLLDVIFTTDGKEYLTPQQLVREIRDELIVHGGRVNLVELAKLLNVDLLQVTTCAREVERSDPGVKIVLGQLIDKSYIKLIAEEVNQQLIHQGQISISDLTRQYDLPSDFLSTVVEKNLGKIIHAKRDKSDPQIYFTESYVTRNTACIRGALAAATKPTSISTLLSHLEIPETLFFSIIDNLLATKQIPGTVTGRQAGNSIYVPSVYSKSQNDWVNGFYKQNGYLEYDALTRLGISDPKVFISKHFSNEKIMYVSSCAVGLQLIEQVEASVEEAVTSGSWVDVMPLLPSVFEPEDVEEILQSVLQGKKSLSTATVFCNTVVLAETFLQTLSKSLEGIIQKRAEEAVTSGTYLKSEVESKLQHGKGHVESSEGSSSKADRREERRKKAASGKVGGGTQGRETKTKSTKKKYMRGKAAVEDSDDEEQSYKGNTKQTTSHKLELLSLSDIIEIIKKHESFSDDDDIDDLIEQVAVSLLPAANKEALAIAQKLFESSLDERAHSRRKTHGELQDKLNILATNVRMFEKGLKQFESKEVQQQLSKYLLKSIGTEIANEIFSYVAQENLIQFDQSKEMTVEMRVKILNDVPNNAKEPLMKLHKSLTGDSVEEFMTSMEVALGQGICDMVLKKHDKKKERPQVHGHRHALLEQLSSSTDPALVLHLTSLILFVSVTQTMLQASGRFVSNILSFLKSHLTPDVYNSLQMYHDLVLKLLSTNKDDDSYIKIIQTLEEETPKIKEIASSYKRPSISEKS